jgi:chromosome segregation ATPase
MGDQGELFLTRVDAGGPRTNPSHHRQLLSQVRKEHSKIQEVVEAFRTKVDRMVDKQRQEYVAAYEHHIQDVQRELHQLREKAHQIANDRTKNERTEKLQLDLANYKNEALELEAMSDELRVEMAELVRQVYSVEKYRDWMLRKLRHAKKQYNYLVKGGVYTQYHTNYMLNTIQIICTNALFRFV